MKLSKFQARTTRKDVLTQNNLMKWYPILFSDRFGVIPKEVMIFTIVG